MRIDIVSLFPEMFSGPMACSILGRAQSAGLARISVVNPRDFAADKHHIVDDYPFGGGSGMVMKPEPFFSCVESLVSELPPPRSRIILMSPAAPRFCQSDALRLSQLEHLILLCGHYEGVDERVREYLCDEALSVGDYVLTGGELPAMVVTDAVVRLLPGVLGAEDAAALDSYAAGLLEYPQYTRPRKFRELEVPTVLLSGNHAEINRWRRQQSLQKTYELRPDLLESAELSPADRKFLDLLRCGNDKRSN
jgi:tRNA (guanine37-N1)-methyltransferase